MQRKIKVLRLQHGLVEPSNHRLLDEFSGMQGIEVHAICPRWGIESGSRRVLRDSRPDITVARTVLTRRYSTKIFLSHLAALIKSMKPDVIDIHEEPWSLATAQVLAYRRMYSPGSRVLVYSAQNIFKKFPEPFASIEKAALRSTRTGYACSEGVAEVMRRRGFEGRIDIVPLGIDPEEFSFRKHPGELEDGILHVGFVGRVVEEKGVCELIRAVAAAGPKAKLTLVGPTPEIELTKMLIRELDAEDRIMTAGAVEHARVAGLMKQFDVLVVPSRTTPTWKEQFGRVIVEAMSLGVPVAGSDSGSIPEVIGDAGLVFPEKDMSSLRDILVRLMDNPGELTEISEAGRERVMEKFTWKCVAEKMYELYRHVFNER